MKEIWKDIEDYEGLYQVSNLGRVRAKKVGFYKQKALTNKKPYLITTLYRNNIGKTLYVHRLVLMAFVGQPPSKEHECRHLDGNPHNNNIHNLTWGTSSENAIDVLKHGRHNRAKLEIKHVLSIRQMLLEGHKTQREIAEIFGVDRTLISCIKLNKVWSYVR